RSEDVQGGTKARLVPTPRGDPRTFDDGRKVVRCPTHDLVEQRERFGICFGRVQALQFIGQGEPCAETFTIEFDRAPKLHDRFVQSTTRGFHSRGKQDQIPVVRRQRQRPVHWCSGRVELSEAQLRQPEV